MKDTEELVRQGRVQRIPENPAAAERLLADAHKHLDTAQRALDHDDLAGAYQLSYDAARKSLTALLLARGLRVRGGTGTHATLIEAATMLLGDEDPGDLRRLDRLRRTRNRAEYDGYFFTRDEVEADFEVARSVVESARRLGPP